MTDPRSPKAPKERTETHREALHAALRHGPRSARELSAEVGLTERDVLAHLGHLDRSLDHTGERLDVEPSRCLACDYVFEDRTRLTKPGRCPRCRGTRIAQPRFAIVAESG